MGRGCQVLYGGSNPEGTAPDDHPDIRGHDHRHRHWADLGSICNHKSETIQVLAEGYVTFFRGTPVLVQLIFWFNIAAHLSRTQHRYPLHRHHSCTRH